MFFFYSIVKYFVDKNRTIRIEFFDVFSKLALHESVFDISLSKQKIFRIVDFRNNSKNRKYEYKNARVKSICNNDYYNWNETKKTKIWQKFELFDLNANEKFFENLKFEIEKIYSYDDSFFSWYSQISQ